jgi:SAM-dependent methyltransferase
MKEQPLKIDAAFWDELWKTKFTNWDLKAVSPPLKAFIDTLADKSISILIPGCGNAYEAEYLLSNGFTQVTVIDIAPTLTAELLEKFTPSIGKELTVISGDFFKHTGQYDLILEQTFFCALDPKLRAAYAVQMHNLLKPNGKLAGLLFNTTFKGGPPFGGSKEEYISLFKEQFNLDKIEESTNSVKPRLGAELFIELTPKN